MYITLYNLILDKIAEKKQSSVVLVRTQKKVKKNKRKKTRTKKKETHFFKNSFIHSNQMQSNLFAVSLMWVSTTISRFNARNQFGSGG